MTYQEDLNKIIDSYLLRFLDEFEEAHGRLPSEQDRAVWMAGFIDGCYAIRTAISVTPGILMEDLDEGL